MARLFEYQGKALLREHGIRIPRGRVASSAEEVFEIAQELGSSVVLKSQVWSTQRARSGGIQFVATPDEARTCAVSMLGQEIQGFRVTEILVEERVAIAYECFAAILIDGEQRQPRVLFSTIGGTGVEQIAYNHPGRLATLLVDVREGLHPYQARALAQQAGLASRHQNKFGHVLAALYQVAEACEARSVEINPLVMTDDGNVVAADCRIAVDDYAAYRHPELEIDVAREFSRPPTALDRVAYDVERDDYRGTFYFMQLASGIKRGEGFVGFHGAGGGGSMMAMDALHGEGLKLANFTDTSGNPPASKVYRAAKIILSQPGIDGYFASGSGVASQEQTNGSRGLAKAFREEQLSIPAVIRLGGNQEDRAVALLHKYTRDLPAPVEGYKKDDSADACAARLVALIAAHEPCPAMPPQAPIDAKEPYRFDTQTGTICYDHARCLDCASKACVSACEPAILKLEEGVPVLAITKEEARKGGCTECLACELECAFEGNGGATISLPIEGLPAYRSTAAGQPGAYV